MIRSFLYLDVKPGRCDDVIRWYKEVGALEKAVEYANCHTTEIYAVPEAEDRLLVTALWPRAEDYQAWVDHPWRRSTSTALSAFLREEFTTESKGAVLSSLHEAPSA